MIKELKGTSSHIADRIRESILHGTLTPGTQLHQEQLADEYGVSRSPIREALRQLQAEGLVDYRPNYGAVVSTRSRADVLEIIEIRKLLEAAVIKSAIPKLTAADFRRARHLLAEMKAASDRQRVSELSWAFHETLYAASGRQLMIRLIREHQLRIDSGHSGETLVQVVKQMTPGLRELLDACEARDTRRATSLVLSQLDIIAKHAAASVAANR